MLGGDEGKAYVIGAFKFSDKHARVGCVDAELLVEKGLEVGGGGGGGGDGGGDGGGGHGASEWVMMLVVRKRG